MVILKYLRNSWEYKKTVSTGLQGLKNATQNAFTGLCKCNGDSTGIFSVQQLFHKMSIFFMVRLDSNRWNFSGTVKIIKKRFGLGCKASKVPLKMRSQESAGQKGTRGSVIRFSYVFMNLSISTVSEISLRHHWCDTLLTLTHFFRTDSLQDDNFRVGVNVSYIFFFLRKTG